MPNHVTNRIQATTAVIHSMLDESGQVDFAKIIPFPGEWPWDDVSEAAQAAADIALNVPLHENVTITNWQAKNRESSSIAALPERDFEQFIQMLRNFRATGFMHYLSFTRENWGTKWNAYEQEIDAAAGKVKFDTAWSCPIPVLQALSASHPTELIEVQFADEDLGSNCGTIHFKAGEIVHHDVSPGWQQLNEEGQKRREAFAYEVKGYDPEDDQW
ncbi:hypothetical protein BVH01_09665 [Pseudomonas sp. PA1(2017)]|uniref:DUF1281 family ferredoxin-like fold protein n=1 Tax=Pseudomonas sp. PA1(2017) TaxID=1932113 RepID=UPI00095F54DB|nr:hypothetical protein [Pseudomonas sp. PA1(2017)]OLU16831.1 hypothetical protein BVH01_09665 [Pseudomonas sp. PA1(2017)]